MPQLVTTYDELKLRIEPGQGGGHRVLALSSSGEATAPFELPFTDQQIEAFVVRVGRPRAATPGDTSSMAAAEAFGGKLFDALFHGEVRDLYRSSLTRSRAMGHGLRVTLALSGAPELMDVPWEYLYDDPSFLAVSAFTPIVRYLDLPQACRPLEIEPPMRILAMVSSPNDLPPLDVDKERTNLEQALGGLIEAGAVEIRWLERPTLASLLRLLQSDVFHALHFVGHGTYDEATGQGMLVLQDDGGWAKPIAGDKLGTILQDFTSLRLAVLNACEGARTSRADPFAGVAASVVERGIPAVIAMQFEITDAAAVTFAEGFYRGLASGAPADAALAAARLAIFAERSDDIEWGTPVLFMRVGDGQVFDVPAPVVSAPAVPAPVESIPEPALPQGAPPAVRTLERPAAKPAPTRRGPLVAAGIAAAAVVGVVAVLASGGDGDHGGVSDVQAQSANPTTRTPTTTGGQATATGTTGKRILGGPTKTVGPLTLVAKQVVASDGQLALTLHGVSSAGLTLFIYRTLVAVDDRGNSYPTRPSDDWTLLPGAPVDRVFSFDLPSGGIPSGSRLTVGFTFVQRTDLQPFPNGGITLSGIPLPG